MLGGAVKMAADVKKMATDSKWCPSCLKSGGVKSRIRVMQINLEEAAVLCDNPKCYRNARSKVLPRSVAKLASLKQRKKHRQTSLSSSPSTPIPQTGPLSPSLHGQLPHGIPGSTNSGTVLASPLLRTTLWEDKVLQWTNKDALCWLDVSMCALVQCVSLRACLQRQCVTTLLKDLCHEFDKAQTVGRGGVFGDPQLYERTDHDRLNDTETSSKTTSSDLSSIMQYPTSLHSSLSHLDADAALELLVMSDEEGIKKKDQLMNATNKNSKQSDHLTTTPTRDASTILEDIREKIRASLEPKLNCQLGQEESPVFALPLLARLSGAVEEHFLVRYRWEFYCQVCQHTDIKMCKKSMISLTSLPSDFTLSAPSILRMCPACHSPGQTSHMTYHSTPACMMFHFSSGVHNTDVTSWSVQPIPNYSYEVSCVIQYSKNPNHFIAWCRDVQRDMWLKCNDLHDALCEWQTAPPVIPASEIHIIMLERQGDPCTDCDTMNSQMTRISCNIDQMVEKVALLKARPTPKNGQITRAITPNHRDSYAVSSDGLNSSAVGNSSVHNVKNSLNFPTVGGLKHLGRKRFSSFRDSGASVNQQTPSHLTVIDLDMDAEESCEVQEGGTVIGLVKLISVAKDETSSTVSSSTVSSYRRGKRSLPKYLQTNGKLNSVRKKTLETESTPEQTDDASSIVTTATYKSSQPSTVSTTKYGNSNVYTKKLKSIRRVSSAGGGMYFQRKALYPGYSPQQGYQGDENQMATSKTNLSASLPEGAFVKYTAWKSQNSYAKSSDRSSSSSPTDLNQTKSLQVLVANTLRPRCNSLSSVSSPSACSDLSSLSDNTSVSGGKDDLTSTIDELYKVLDISTETARCSSRIPSPTFDDDFLAEILADDPVPAALPSTSDSVRSTPNKREPSLVNDGQVVANNQALEYLVPSIEPMEQGLLEKLVA